MAFFSWRRWLGQTFGTRKQARRQRPERQRDRYQRPTLEILETRLAPTVSSTVIAGALTVTGTFNDIMVVTSSGGNVKVDGADPTGGPFASSTISSIVVNGGPGFNVVDLTNVLPANFTSLASIHVNGGVGQDTFNVNPYFPTTVDSGNQPDLVEVSGSATNVIEDLVHSAISVDGEVISIPNSGPGNVFLNLNMASLTIEPTAGNHRILSDNGTPNDGISRAYNASTNTYTDFKNPTASLTVADTTGGGDTFEYQGLDAKGQPPSISLNSNGNADTLIFDGTATNTAFNFQGARVSIDNTVINIPNQGGDIVDNVHTANLVFLGSVSQTVSDGPNPGNGYSRINAPSLNLHTDFLNPTNSLTVQDTSTGGQTFAFDGLDTLGTPPTITINTNNQPDLIKFDGTYGNITEDLVNSLVHLDSVTVAIPNDGPADIQFNTTETSLTIEPTEGNHRVLMVSPSNIAFSRAFNATTSTWTDFKNPSNSLTVKDTNTGGGSTYEFMGLATPAPANIVLDVGNQADLVQFDGTYSAVTEDLANSLVHLDSTVIGIPNGGPSDIEFNTTETSLTIEPTAGNHRVLEASPNPGFSRAFNATTNRWTDFINPSIALDVKDTNVTGGSTYEFMGLAPGAQPTSITLDTGNNASDFYQFDGTYTNVTVDFHNANAVVCGVISLSATVVTIAGASTNLVMNTTETNFTLKPFVGNHRIIEPSPVFGFTRALNASSGDVTDFINPTGTLDVQDVNSGGGSTYEFAGLGFGPTPTSIVLDVNNQADLVQFDGTYQNVTEDLVNSLVHLDSTVIGIPNGGPSDIEFNTMETNLTIEPTAANHRILEVSPNPGFSRAFNQTTNRFTDFINPTGTLTVLDTNSSGGSTYEFMGVAVPAPASIVLDVGNQDDLVQFDGAYQNITEDLVNSLVHLDSTVIGIPNGGPSDIEFNTNETNLTIEPTAANHRVLEASPNPGFSRAFNATTNRFTDFINPTGTLTVKDTNSTGGSTYEYMGLAAPAPASIVLDVGNQHDLVQFDGTYGAVTEDLVNSLVSLDSTVIGIPNGGPSDIEFNTSETSLTIEPTAGNHRVLQVSPNPGFSRAFNATTNRFTDFINPTGTLTVLDTNSSGGSTYEYIGLAAPAPASIVLDVNNQADLVQFDGTYGAVTEDLVNSLVHLDSTTIGIPNGGPSDIAFNTTEASLAIEPTAANHRILEVSPNPGYSRAFNATTDRFTDFKNPTTSLTVKDTNSGGGSTYEFMGLAAPAPASIVLDVNNQHDLVQFDGTYGAVTEDLVNSLIHLDSTTVGIPNGGPSDIEFNTSETNLTIEPTAGNHRVLEVSPNPGFSRAFNATTNRFTDFINPTGTLAVKDTNSTGGSTYEFVGLAAGPQPTTIILDTGTTNGDVQMFDGAFTNVVADYHLPNNTVSLDGTVINLPGTGNNLVVLNTTETDFTLEPQPDNHRELEASPTAGFTRAANVTSGTYTDFINPTGILDIKDVNSTGGSTYEFAGLGTGSPPKSIMLDTGTNASDTYQFDGTYTNAVVDFHNANATICGTISLDSTVVNIAGAATMLVMNTTEINFTLQPFAGNHRIIEPSPVSGFTRALNATSGDITDFINPTGALNITDVNTTGGSTYEFVGLAATPKPAIINLNTGVAGDLQLFDGTYTTVVEDLVNNVVSLDSLVVGIPGSGPSSLEFNTHETTLTIEPQSGNHRIIEASPVSGFSRAFNADTSTFTDFINPTGTLNITDTNRAGGSTYEFVGLAATPKPTAINLNTGVAGDVQQFDGTYTNVTEDLVHNNVSLDGLVVGIPGSGPSNLVFNTTETNLTIEPQPGNHRIIEPSPVSGFTRAFNADTQTYTDFLNPTGSLTIKDTNSSGGSTYEFAGLGVSAMPPTITLDTGTTNGDVQKFDGTFTNVVADYHLPNNTISLDGTIINLPGTGNNEVVLNTHETNFTLEPQPGNHRELEPSPVPGFTRAANVSSGTYTDFINPSGALTVKDINPSGVSTYEFAGLGSGPKPANISLDTGANADVQQFDGNFTNVVTDYHLPNNTINLDGTIINLPGTGNNLVVLNTTETNFTLEPQPGNHRELEPSPVAGFTRAANLTSGTYTDFINPTGTLNITDVNTTGGSTYEFMGIAASPQPAAINLNTGVAGDVQLFDGTYGTVTEDLVHNEVSLDGLVVGIPGSGPSNLEFNTHETTLTIEPQPGNHRIIEASPVPGFTRAFNADTMTYTDFINPTGTLNITDINATGGSTYEFMGLAATPTPAVINLNTGVAGDLQLFDGTYSSVTEDLVHNLVTLGSLVIGIPGSGPSNLEFNTTEATLTIEPQPGNHRIIEPSPVPGFTRAFNASTSTYTDFINPTGTLNITDTNSSGGSTYEFVGLAATPTPAAINLNTGVVGDVQKFDGTYGAVTEDLVHNNVSLDGLVIGVPGSGPSNLVFNTTETTLTIEPQANNHRIIEPSPVSGFTRAFNASTNTYTDFINPLGPLTILDTNSGDTATYEFVGLASAPRPSSITLNAGSNNDTIQFSGTAGSVIENVPARTMSIDGQVVGFPSSSGTIFMDVHAASFTFIMANGANEVISDDTTPNDGISLATNLATGLHTDFVNPTTLLTFRVSSAGTSFTFNGLDSAGGPATANLDSTGFTTALTFKGATSNVTGIFNLIPDGSIPASPPSPPSASDPKGTPTSIATADNGTVAAAFPGEGVWLYAGGAWKQLGTVDASQVGVDDNGNVVASLVTGGVWRYESGSGLVELTASDASSVGIAGNGIVVAAFPFVGGGVWRYKDAGGWFELTANNANQVGVDGFGDVVAALNSGGVWRYEDVGGFVELSQTTPSQVGIAGNGIVVAAFSIAGGGVWRFEDAGGWRELTTTNATTVGVDANGDVVALLVTGGVSRFKDSTGFQQLTTTTAFLVSIGGNGNVAAVLAGGGVWLFTDASGWTLLPTSV